MVVMDLNKAFAVLEVLGSDKHRKTVRNARALMNIMELSKDKQILKKMAFYNILDNIAPQGAIKANYARFLPPQERKIRELSALTLR